MLRAYKYELNPTEEQKSFFEQSFGCVRVVYNYCLQRRIEVYQSSNKCISQFDLSAEVTQLKRKEGYRWLANADHQSLGQAVRSLDKAFTKFFREKKGFPKFKSKKSSKQSCQFTQGIKVDFKNKRIKFPKTGWVKTRFSRTFDGKIKSVTTSRNAVGKYFASILVDDEIILPAKSGITERYSIGIDLGIKTFAVFSDGTNVANPKYLSHSEKTLSILQRRLSRKQNGSKRRERAKLAVAKINYKIANQRKDFLHKTSTAIIKQYDSIVMEDLNVAGMMKNGNLAKSISDVGWSTFNAMLRYKCDWYGKNYIQIGRFEPSSRMCPCGVINKELKLSDRTWKCDSCGAVHDRDLLAAQNIKRFGLQKQNLLSPAGSGAGRMELPQ